MIWRTENTRDGQPKVGHSGRIRTSPQTLKLLTSRTLVLRGGPAGRGGSWCPGQGPEDLSYAEGWGLPSAAMELPCKYTKSVITNPQKNERAMTTSQGCWRGKADIAKESGRLLEGRSER